jgi:hypothetical protein
MNMRGFTLSWDAGIGDRFFFWGGFFGVKGQEDGEFPDAMRTPEGHDFPP